MGAGKQGVVGVRDMLKRDYEEMTKALVEYLNSMKNQTTGWVSTTQAKDEVLRTLRAILEGYGVEVTA